jgi:hypothetical protein
MVKDLEGRWGAGNKMKKKIQKEALPTEVSYFTRQEASRVLVEIKWPRNLTPRLASCVKAS